MVPKTFTLSNGQKIPSLGLGTVSHLGPVSGMMALTIVFLVCYLPPLPAYLIIIAHM
jgi:hypothetical protein